ncbi:hypothetical protein O7626_40410 [Micromonospora sp. WMMD1102]|uniref:hypothetical protein n=1 Tax=Micromonospora sp. WMMD1102 TaxID=3016105 RepID=UPI002414FA4A|nr:hypothetical protein [Micromonospora sp. WMMD1102]MDG4792082.1 hypothetical protein [Micromonospora sp. WMMD1102]
MTTTALAFPEPDDRSPLDIELEGYARWVSVALTDPTTDPKTRADLDVISGSFDVFSPTRRPNADPEFRAAMLDVFQRPLKRGGMWDAVWGAAANYAYGKGREVA